MLTSVLGHTVAVVAEDEKVALAEELLRTSDISTGEARGLAKMLIIKAEALVAVKVGTADQQVAEAVKLMALAEQAYEDMLAQIKAEYEAGMTELGAVEAGAKAEVEMLSAEGRQLRSAADLL